MTEIRPRVVATIYRRIVASEDANGVPHGEPAAAWAGTGASDGEKRAAIALYTVRIQEGEEETARCQAKTDAMSLALILMEPYSTGPQAAVGDVLAAMPPDEAADAVALMKAAGFRWNDAA